MGHDLYAASPAARRVLDAADQTLGFRLTRLLFEGPADDLLQTINTQPAIVAVSLAAVAVLREAWESAGRGALPQPAFVAGHSVGEYAALVASGAADEATGLRLVRERARMMQQAGETTPGGMVAVLGLPQGAVAEACRQARAQVSGSYVDVANHNAAAQVVIAGDAGGLAAATKFCQTAGARRCVPLTVSAAFHTRAMAAAAAPLAAVVQSAGIVDARVPLLANVTARPTTAAAELCTELATQVAKPVLWAESVQRMIEAGVTKFLEFGNGKVLTGLIERLGGGLSALPIGDTAGVRTALDWLPARLG